MDDGLAPLKIEKSKPTSEYKIVPFTIHSGSEKYNQPTLLKGINILASKSIIYIFHDDHLSWSHGPLVLFDISKPEFIYGYYDGLRIKERKYKKFKFKSNYLKT